MFPIPLSCTRFAFAFAAGLTALLHGPSAHATVETMIVTSDPQYPWTDTPGEADEVRKIRSRQMIEEQYRSIAAYRARRPDQTIPVFINGDLTAYGHGWQRAVMDELLGILGDNVYLGLGNHDYQNNILQEDGSGCYNNGCARDSVLGLVQHVMTKPDKVSFDFSVRPGFPGNRYEGSLAYAVNTPGWERVLQVQLNNYPTYEVSFASTEGLRPSRFDIGSSLPWLKNVLDTHLSVPRYGTPADRAYDFGIAHVHSADGYSEGFGEALAAGHVAAVFAGHLHFRLGRYGSINGVPVFLSGSASQRTYLIVEHDTVARVLRVFAVRNNDPEGRELIATVDVDTV